MSKYIKLLIGVFLMGLVMCFPVKASAITVNGVDIEVYEFEETTAIYNEIRLRGGVTSRTTALFMVEGSDGVSYMIYCTDNQPTSPIEATLFYTVGRETLGILMPTCKYVWDSDLKYLQGNANGRKMTNTPVVIGNKLRIGVCRSRTNSTLYVDDVEIWNPSSPTPSPTPTPTPTPTPIPVTKVEMSETGFSESMSVALEFMRIPIEIVGIEVNMFEIMMFGFACTLVIYLVFSPVKK